MASSRVLSMVSVLGCVLVAVLVQALVMAPVDGQRAPSYSGGGSSYSGRSSWGSSYSYSSYSFRSSGSSECTGDCAIIVGAIIGGIVALALCAFLCLRCAACISAASSSTLSSGHRNNNNSLHGGAGADGDRPMMTGVWADIQTHANYLATTSDYPYGQAPVSLSAEAASMPSFPIGTQQWKGHYRGNSSLNNGQFTMEISLKFENGRVSGEGSDDVGRFTISGRYNDQSLRVAFTKQYIGMHQVEYRGVRSRERGLGLLGTWYVRDPLGNDQGDFRIWPKNSDWQAVNPQAPELATFNPVTGQMEYGLPPSTQPASPAAGGFQAPPPSIVLYDAVGRAECFVCFTNSVDTLFVPCGHIVACTACALATVKCPICSSPIERYVPCTRPENAPVAFGPHSPQPPSAPFSPQPPSAPFPSQPSAPLVY